MFHCERVIATSTTLGTEEKNMGSARGLRAKTISRREFLCRAGSAGVGISAAGALGLLSISCGGPQGGEGPAPKGTKVSGELTLVYLGTAEQQEAWKAL